LRLQCRVLYFPADFCTLDRLGTRVLTLDFGDDYRPVCRQRGWMDGWSPGRWVVAPIKAAGLLIGLLFPAVLSDL